MTETFPRPVLSERRRELLQSLGLTATCTELAIIVSHPDQTITRLDEASFGVWLDGYLLGRSAGKRTITVTEGTR